MRRTILLADDSPTIRRLVRETFADENFEIVEVSNGDAAIKKVEEVKPSIVLADIYMPGKNGYQVCAYIRAHSELHAIPVVLLVGAFDAFDEETARQAGATANITKPFEPGALTDLVMSLLPSEEEAPAAPAPAPAQAAEAPAAEAAEVAPAPVEHEMPSAPEPGEADLLGLESMFHEEEPAAVPPAVLTLTDDDIDRIADRVIQRLSTQVIESIAWDIIPDITEKIVREELKKKK